MRYPHYDGIGERLEQALIAAGYVRKDGRPDKGRFVRTVKFDGRYFYAYLKGRTPTGEWLEKLCADLKITRSWLLHGEGVGPAVRRAARRVLACLVAAVAIGGVLPPTASPHSAFSTIPESYSAHYDKRRRRKINGWCGLPDAGKPHALRLVFRSGFPRLTAAAAA